jgi:Domain of unknown function (DUF397)
VAPWSARWHDQSPAGVHTFVSGLCRWSFSTGGVPLAYVCSASPEASQDPAGELMGEMDQPNPVTWRKSTFSGANECVEVAFVGQSVMVRDSKSTADLPLTFPIYAWRVFLARVKAGATESTG